jgi:rRNA-processing protein FCF1
MSSKTLLLAIEYEVYHVLLETNLILAMSSKTLLLAIEYEVYHVLLETNLILAMSSKTLLHDKNITLISEFTVDVY